MKSYLELEQIGIITCYKHNNTLFIIVKGGEVYQYIPNRLMFVHIETL